MPVPRLSRFKERRKMSEEITARASLRLEWQLEKRSKTWRDASSEAKRIASAYKIPIAEACDLANRVTGPCDACGRRPEKRVNSVDHDHRTGKVRGILCQPCNYALGCVNDNEQKLLNLIMYLKK